MSHSVFGWSYPRGCSGPPEDDELTTYEKLESIINHIEKSMKELDNIDTSNPMEDDLEAAYAKLEDARKAAKNLQKNASYEDEED